jgi:hypothetical protein
MERLVVPVALGEQTFRFDLCRRSLDLGPDGPKLVYYWMDVRPLRRGDCSNYRACVDFWWACMESEGLAALREGQSAADEEDVVANEVTLVLAEMYRFVARSKGQQRVFLDAFPGSTADDDADEAAARGAGSYTLNEDELTRLKEIVARRDVESIRDELRDVLAGEPPPEADGSALAEAYRTWIDVGRAALRRGGQEELRRVLETEWDGQVVRLRKLGGEPTLKRLLNLVAYQAKVCFYTCYANAWAGLIPVLREQHGLDAASEASTCCGSGTTNSRASTTCSGVRSSPCTQSRRC